MVFSETIVNHCRVLVIGDVFFVVNGFGLLGLQIFPVWCNDTIDFFSISFSKNCLNNNELKRRGFSKITTYAKETLSTY